MVGPKDLLAAEALGDEVTLVEEGKNIVENMERGFMATA